MQQSVPQQQKPYAPPPMSRVEKAFSRMFRNDALSEQNGRCAYCRSLLPRDEATADHRIPRVSGGATTRKNIKAACEDCNKAKGWMSEAAFLKRIKNPQHGDDIRIWMAWARRRIALATERACKRIMAMTQ